ncbi:MAG TPA: hypothetical protein VHM30_12830, partial [Gemmatimonadaceae bacterium]|nr:hypothetical protein [Gemmatimonadaceae bacterium]
MSYRIPSALPRDWRPRSRAVAALVAALTFAAACGEVVDPVSPGRSPRGLSAALEEEQGVCDQLLEIAANGTYCGVNTRIVPWAPADAYWGGATFQSDPGHGQSHDITITFDAPVAQVEITAYDPTFAGNAMYA